MSEEQEYNAKMLVKNAQDKIVKETDKMFAQTDLEEGEEEAVYIGKSLNELQMEKAANRVYTPEDLKKMAALQDEVE